jgi:hypothetical protein
MNAGKTVFQYENEFGENAGVEAKLAAADAFSGTNADQVKELAATVKDQWAAYQANPEGYFDSVELFELDTMIGGTGLNDLELVRTLAENSADAIDWLDEHGATLHNVSSFGGASVNPQIAQFMELCIAKTRSFLGASDVAMGDSRPDNTSAIIALQRAANTPMEMTKQNLFACVEEMGMIWMDMMAAKYGVRKVETTMMLDKPGEQPLGMAVPAAPFMVDFDFSALKNIRVAIKQDVGASSYWSEIANMQTLDNLLMNNKITLKQYLERIPNGYISKKQELINEIEAMTAQPAAPMGTGLSKDTMDQVSADQIPVEGGPGNAALQRALNKEGA